MTGQATHDTITSLNNNISRIAQNDALKGLLPVIDTFLTNVQANQAGGVGLLAQVNALLPNLQAALPNLGNQIVKDEAGAVKENVDAAAAKLAAGNDTQAGSASTGEANQAGGDTQTGHTAG